MRQLTTRNNDIKNLREDTDRIIERLRNDKDRTIEDLEKLIEILHNQLAIARAAAAAAAVPMY